MHLALQFSLLCLGVAFAVALVVVEAVSLRRRARQSAEIARRVEDLARRQRELEALVAKLEKAHPARSFKPEPAELKGLEETVPRTSRRVDQAVANAVAGPTLIAIPNMSAPQHMGASVANAELGRKFRAVWELADAGTPAETIAKRTGQPIGQVELIMGLRRQMTNVGGSSNSGSRT